MLLRPVWTAAILTPVPKHSDIMSLPLALCRHLRGVAVSLTVEHCYLTWPCCYAMHTEETFDEGCLRGVAMPSLTLASFEAQHGIDQS